MLAPFSFYYKFIANKYKGKFVTLHIYITLSIILLSISYRYNTVFLVRNRLKATLFLARPVMGNDIDTGGRQVSRGRRKAASYAASLIPVTKCIRQGLRL